MFSSIHRFEELEDRCRDSFRGQRNVTLFLKNNEAVSLGLSFIYGVICGTSRGPQELCFLTGSLSRTQMILTGREWEISWAKGTSGDFPLGVMRSKHLCSHSCHSSSSLSRRRLRILLKVQDELLISIHVYVVSGFMLSRSSGPHMGKE